MPNNARRSYGESFGSLLYFLRSFITKELSISFLIERQVLRRHRLAGATSSWKIVSAAMRPVVIARFEPSRWTAFTKCAGVADDQPAVAEKLRHRLVAALGDQVRGIFLDLRSCEQRCDGGVRLECLQQSVGRLPVSAKSATRQPMPIEMHSLLV